MNSGNRVWVTECPRDAMQGITDFISTKTKVEYLNTLLEAGFDRLDFGSFVSPKAVPQMRDTREVLDQLVPGSGTSLIAIVANVRGAREALETGKVDFIGYPFSVSETFQVRNTNTGIAASFDNVLRMSDEAGKAGKGLIVYISMAFGNPYGDPWNADLVSGWVLQLWNAGIRNISLSDTVGIATEKEVAAITGQTIREFPGMETGVHLHCKPDNWREKVSAAFDNGCRRFDSAIRGYGGCPMAGDELTGNLATENLVKYLIEKNVESRIIPEKFDRALRASARIFLASA
jgi:hydroxymethylglutaryl-CoA lyase